MGRKVKKTPRTNYFIISFASFIIGWFLIISNKTDIGLLFGILRAVIIISIGLLLLFFGIFPSAKFQKWISRPGKHRYKKDLFGEKGRADNC